MWKFADNIDSKGCDDWKGMLSGDSDHSQPVAGSTMLCYDPEKVTGSRPNAWNIRDLEKKPRQQG